MNIELYLSISYNESALKILNLLDSNKIEFSVQTFDEESLDIVSKLVGEKVRRLPIVVIEGKKIGGYYDLCEYLINEKIINYEGKLCQPIPT